MEQQYSPIAINEAVFFLANIQNDKLKELKNLYPDLAKELKEGILAGEKEQEEYIVNHAKVMITTLQEAAKEAKKRIEILSLRMRKAQRYRLISQILVLIGSSTVLGSLKLNGNDYLTIISAIVTLLASIGNLLAEYNERALSQNNENIYILLHKFSDAMFKSKNLEMELELAILGQFNIKKLSNLIIQGNKLFFELNSWMIKI